MGKKGKNSSSSQGFPSKRFSLKNAVKNELGNYCGEKSLNERAEVRELGRSLQDPRDRDSCDSSSSFGFQRGSNRGVSISSAAASLASASLSSSQVASRKREEAAAARWHYSSPRVRLARDTLLTGLLQECYRPRTQGCKLIDDEDAAVARAVSASASGGGAGLRDPEAEPKCLRSLCLESIAANLPHYDNPVELRSCLHSVLQAPDLLRLSVLGCKLHTLNDANMQVVTSLDSCVSVCPRDLTHAGLVQLLRAYELDIVLQDWKDFDQEQEPASNIETGVPRASPVLNTSALDRFAGPKRLVFIGSALSPLSFDLLRPLVVLESLVLHAVAPPSFSESCSNSEFKNFVSTHAPQMVRDWILAKMVERGLCQKRGEGERQASAEWRSSSNSSAPSSIDIDRDALSGSSGKSKDRDREKSVPGFSCATLLCALFLSGSSSPSTSAVDGAASGQKGKSRRQRTSCDNDNEKKVEVDAALIGACGAHAEFKDNGSGSGSAPVPRDAPPRLANIPFAGFEFLASLTFSHCKWGWTVESLLLFAYLLNVSRVSVPHSEAASGTGTSNGVSSHSEKCNGHLSRLRVICIEGSDLFEPPAGFATLCKADKMKLCEICAIFRSICEVKLVIDGVSDDSDNTLGGI